MYSGTEGYAQLIRIPIAHSIVILFLFIIFPYVLHSLIVLHWEKLINFSSCLTRLGSFKEYHSGVTESSTSCMSEPYCKYPVTTRKKIVLHFFFLVVLHLRKPSCLTLFLWLSYTYRTRCVTVKVRQISLFVLLFRRCGPDPLSHEINLALPEINL